MREEYDFSTMQARKKPYIKRLRKQGMADIGKGIETFQFIHGDARDSNDVSTGQREDVSRDEN